MSGWKPVDPAQSVLTPLGMDHVTVEGGYWADRQRVNRDVTLPHIDSWLERMGWLANFGGSARTVDGRGEEFTDSEVYKFLEGLCWESARTGFPRELEDRIAALTSRIADVQAADGYVGTAFGGPGQRPRYSDLAFGHELYCAGHLLQSVIARGRTVGVDDPLVVVGTRVADHITEAFGPDGIDGICGHPIIEMALTELSRLTGDTAYRDQAALFLERRGHHRLPRTHRGSEYFSDDETIRSAQVLRGHAVRALYLASGAVDVAVDTADAELAGAIERQWRHTLARRTYVTGGMGSRHLDEAFGEDDMLPPDRAYSETCAGVASAQLAWRLLLATGRAEHADAIERALFNIVATGVSLSGDRFFYANTLHQRVPAEPTRSDSPTLAFGGGMRAAWYDVSCCPTNIARTIASVGSFVATTSAGGVQIHQFMSGRIRSHLPSGVLELRLTTQYPESGRVEIEVLAAPEEVATLEVRVPSWSSEATLSDTDCVRTVSPGYAKVTRRFSVGDRVTLELTMTPRLIEPDPRVDAVRGCVAVAVGPRIYCLETPATADIDVNALRLSADVPITLRDGLAIAAMRHLETGGDSWWLTSEARQYALTPYAEWGNAGPSTMRVWIPTDGDVR